MYFKINLSQLIISFYFLIILSCITMLLNFELLIIINSLVFLFTVFYLIFFFRINIIFKIFIFLLILINLSTITTSWDARSIWLFKTKIFFYEENILNFHKHPQFSHPTYPFIAPLFASTFVKSLNIWNEIFPKIGIFFLYLPALIFISSKFKKNYLYAFLSISLFVQGKYFIIGEIDGLISIYFLTSLILTYEIIFVKHEQKKNIIIIFFNNIILSLLKFEGTVLVLLICFMFFIHFIFRKRINLKTLVFIILSVAPSILWLLYSIKINNIYQLNDSSFALENLIYRLNNFDNLILIMSYFLSDEKFLLGILFFFVFFFKTNNKDLNYLALSILSLYFIILVMIYLSTNFDLSWHLQSSANRVIKPLTLSFIVITLYNINLYKLKK